MPSKKLKLKLQRLKRNNNLQKVNEKKITQKNLLYII